MEVYKIYHIPGIKIGLSINPKDRVRKTSSNVYEILEEHTDIFIASEREIELQKEYGYRVDRVPYYETIGMINPNSCRKGGITSGNMNKESGHMSAIGKKWGGKNVRHNITFKQAEEIRFRYKTEKITQRQLANEYEIYASTVNRILKNKLYNNGTDY